MTTLDSLTTIEASRPLGTSTPVKVCMLFIEAPARTEARLMRDAVALVQAGFDVTIVDIEKDTTRRQEEDVHGVHLKHIFMPNWYTSTRFKPWFLVKLFRVLVQSTWHLLQTPTDIYHVHVEKAFLAAYIAARLRHKPLLFDAPDLPLSDPHLTRWRFLTSLSARILSLAVPYCSQIITASPLYAQEIRKAYARPDVTVIRNVPPYRQVQKTNRIRKYLGLEDDVRIALYQGNIQPDRELERLVHAAVYLEPKTVIVMMGKGFRGVPEHLETLTAQLGVSDRVKIIPAVPYEELLEWTASADIGLTIFSPTYSLSIRYTLPNKLFEYLMAGLPVLSLELDAIADVLRCYEVGHVLTSLDPTEIGRGINTTLQDEKALAQMHSNALKVAENEFNWEKEREHLVSLYRKVLALPEEGTSGTNKAHRSL